MVSGTNDETGGKRLASAILADWPLFPHLFLECPRAVALSINLEER